MFIVELTYSILFVSNAYIISYRVNNLIGKVLSCRERRYRIVAGLTRLYIYNI